MIPGGGCLYRRGNAKKEIRVRRFVPVLAALVLNASNASAQSVLERVLGQIDGATNLAQVNGVYANIAESVGPSDSPGVVIPGTTTTASVAADFSTAPDATVLWGVEGQLVSISDVGKRFDASDGTSIGNALPSGGSVTVNADGSITVHPGTVGDVEVLNFSTRSIIFVTGSPVTLSLSTTAMVYDLGGGLLLLVTPDEAARMGLNPFFVDVTTTTADTFIPGIPGLSTTIDGSITNIIRGVSAATAEAVAGAVMANTEATEAVEAIIGNLSTTALGAVNTGDIQLIGSNQAFTDDIDSATAGTSEAIQQRIDHTITQVGTTAGQTLLAINSALNETNVNASVLNVMTGVNATIGRSGFEDSLSDTNFTAVAGMDADAIAALTGGISTTALGAVNTGTITSGVNAAVQGIVAMSGQSASGL